ncbi:MAG TPA: acyl-CoA dehydrogenase family protein [Xanthomonadaceae bacterium]|nr:acyl-CoA dehydrogenase family protein [Luteimonas sp.]HRQ64200.1 acyl-CoA dehydrogenase family protein [Xanthomonadaceae bacterium]
MARLSEEQTMLRDAAADWVRECALVTEFRRLREIDDGTGYSTELYAAMAQMGWTGILVPERHGGSEFGCLGMGLVLEQLGRQLVASPLLDSAVAVVSALVLGGSESQQQRWLPRIASGEAAATLAVDEGTRHAPHAIATTAARTAQGWRLDGTKRPVSHAMAADLLVVAARMVAQDGTSAGTGLFLVDAAADGLHRTRLHEIEPRGAAIVEFDGVTLAPDDVLEGGDELLERVLDRARACAAMEMLGAAQQAFETTLEYLKVRTQFGQIIGAFQALQHRAAALYGELELTRSAVEAALQALDADAGDAPAKVSLAKALAGETFRNVVAEMIQLHGGIGMTEEHDAGLYFKRARTADANYGDAAFHRERYGALHGY